MEDKWLEDIKDKLDDYEITPPEGLWEAVQSAADSKLPPKGNPRFRRHRLVAAAAAVAIIAATGVVFHFSSPVADMNTSDYISIARQETDGLTPDTSSLTPALAIASLSPEPRALSSQTPIPAAGNGSANALKTADADASAASEKATSNSDADNHAPQTVTDNATESMETQAADNESPRRMSPIHDGSECKIPVASGRRTRVGGDAGDKISLGIVTGVMDISDTQSHGLPSAGNNTLNPPGPDNPGSNGPSGPSDPVTPDNSDQNNSTNNPGTEGGDFIGSGDDDKNDNTAGGNGDEISHHIPIRVGITVMYRLNNRLGVETGIAYSKLTSDIKYGKDNNDAFSRAKQTLHYIGVPVNIKYIPLSWKRLGVYLSGGVMVEKCVSASLRGHRINEYGRVLPVETVRLHERPWQFSVNAGAGLQLNITNTCGIYLEPGISYFFDNHSSVSTYYTDKPWNFNLNFGFRLSLGQ